MTPKSITLFLAALALSTAALAQKPTPDDAIRTDVTKLLNHKEYAGVQATVANGIITLTGQVPRLADKLELDHKIPHHKDVASLNDQITVAVPEGITDADLQRKLSRGLEYDRVGYGTTMFNSISLGVQNGVVTLVGTVVTPTDKDSALSLVAGTPGVRDIVDHLQVDPVSPNDDRIRLAEARSIYGFPSLNKYALDPGKSIRIVVINGHVTLQGVVDNQSDSDVANLRANSVSGVFSVSNQLQVEGAGK